MFPGKFLGVLRFLCIMYSLLMLFIAFFFFFMEADQWDVCEVLPKKLVEK